MYALDEISCNAVGLDLTLHLLANGDALVQEETAGNPQVAVEFSWDRLRTCSSPFASTFGRGPHAGGQSSTAEIDERSLFSLPEPNKNLRGVYLFDPQSSHSID
jgi:hypothetical protein